MGITSSTSTVSISCRPMGKPQTEAWHKSPENSNIVRRAPGRSRAHPNKKFDGVVGRDHYHAVHLAKCGRAVRAD
jgi:hypothetical protein